MGKVELRFEVDAELVARVRSNGADPLDVLLRGLQHAAELGPQRGCPGGSQAKAPDLSEAERRAREWRAINREAIAEHKRLIAERGLFADSARRW